MIPLFALLLAATPAGPPVPSAAKFETCVKQSDTDPAGAIATATAWQKAGGDVPAGQCLGIAYAAAGAWTSAEKAFAETATLAEARHDGRAANLWVSAGNAALAGNDIGSAKEALSNALDVPSMPDAMRGEVYLDRARAGVASGDLPAARSDMEQALKLVPGDPMAWLLSATLARRMNDVPRATADIKEAENRAPGVADILFEDGNIAATAGDMKAARIAWARAKQADPGGDTGAEATRELVATGGLDVPLPAAQTPMGR